MIWAIVVAAGRGERFGGPKQYQRVNGRLLVDWAVDAAKEHVRDVVLVANASWPDRHESQPTVVVPGGATRSESVRAGLAAVPLAADLIVIHDAARPAAPADLWRAVLAAAQRPGVDGAVPGIAVSDTLKRVDGERVVETVVRSGLYAIQTPQAFRAEPLRRAHAGLAEATDDAALVEAVGGKVVVVRGDPAAVKVTTIADVALISRLL